MVFCWSLSDSKSPQVSRTLLSIQADFNNTVVWMVSTFLLISKSSSPVINHSMTVPSALITIGINIPFMFQFPSKVQVLIFLFPFLSILIYGQPEQQSSQFCKFSFLLIIIRSGFLAEIKWSVCMPKSKMSLCVSFSRIDVGLCI